MIKAVGYRILVKLEKIEDLDPVWKRAKEFGIVRSSHEDALREQAGIDKGIVLQVGPDAYKEQTTPWCKAGDLVAFAKYAGKVVTDPDDTETKYIIINDDDVIAVLKESA